MRFEPNLVAEIAQQLHHLLRQVGDVNEPARRWQCRGTGGTQEAVEARVTQEGAGRVRNPGRNSPTQERVLDLSQRQAGKLGGRSARDERLIVSSVAVVIGD